MAIISKVGETVKCEVYDPLNRTFINIGALHSNFVISEFLHELDSPGGLILCEAKFKDSIHSNNF